MSTYYVKSASGNDFTGTSFTDGSYVDSTRVLTKTGAFSACKPGHKLYVTDNGSGKVVPGRYRITAADANTVTFAEDITSGNQDAADVCCDNTDSRNGTSATYPWCSIQKAFDTAVAGDFVYICADAVYDAPVTIDLDTNAGTNTNNIYFIGANSSGVVDGTRPTIKASATLASGLIRFQTSPTITTHLTFLNLILDGDSKAAFCIVGANDTTGINWWNCQVKNATSDGVNARYNSFFYCEIDHNTGEGVEQTSNRPCSLYNCSIHNNGGHGALINAQSVIVGCLIYSNGLDGLNMGLYADATLCFANTIVGNTGDGIDQSTSAPQIRYIGNIIANNGGYGFRSNSTDISAFIAQNIFGAGASANSLGASDITLPASNLTQDVALLSDYRLKPDSPAYNFINGREAGTLGLGRFPIPASLLGGVLVP